MRRTRAIASLVSVLALLGLVAVPMAVQGQDTDDLPLQNFVEDVSNSGTSAATFLKIGVGARAMAMGNAASTFGRDGTVLFWNPAAAATGERVDDRDNPMRSAPKTAGRPGNPHHDTQILHDQYHGRCYRAG